MEMTEHEQKKLRAYCAFLFKEYGFQFSTHDPVVPALFTIHKEVETLRQSNGELTSRVEAATANVSPVAFHFHYKGEAWKFQMGITIKWISFGLLIALFSTIAVWYWSMQLDVTHLRLMNETFPITAELNKRVMKQDGFYFIDFTAAKGDSVQSFTEFRKLKPNTVRVYLGREKQ